jgi:hypothetical protein
MTKKFYLTRTQTRAMAADHPIGDPTGGAAYGEKNDPVSAIIAIGSMGATYAAAGYTFAAMTVMQGITFAGAALSLVGNITGNKTLMKIGAIAGLAGGIGSMAESAGMFSSGNLGETLGIGADAGAAANLTQTPTAAVQTAGGPAPGSAEYMNIESGNAGSAAAQTSPVQPPSVNNPGSLPPSINTGPAPGSAEYLNLESGITPPPFDPKAVSTNTFGAGPGPGGPLSLKTPAPGFVESMKAGNYLDAASAVGSGAMDMVKGNPYGAYVAAQAIGGVADWLSGKTDAEIAALKANTGFADAKAQEVQLAIAKEETRRANMANRYASLSPQTGITVNPNADARTPGLVAGNMQTRTA